MAAAPDDPSVDVAGAIAAATGESHVVVDMRRAGGEALRLEVRIGTGNHSHRPLRGGSVDYLAEAAPHALRERLTVISGGVLRNKIALAIALGRGVPLLSINLSERERGH